jgi:23S rRNA (adenine2503-C2)-methyltransferase
MGTGEPLDNLKNVLRFFKIVNHPEGINIGMRHITLSTCGIVPEIINLADMNLQITLAISLHAPNDEIRKRLMPIANKYSYDELLNACNYYIEKTNKRITFEYALIDGVNDRKEQAKELSTKLKEMLCHVNLIPINKVKERGYEKSQKARIEEFKQVLLLNGIETTVRRELGSDIDAACGQLRRSYKIES